MEQAGAPSPSPMAAPAEPPARTIRRHKNALTHGITLEEKRQAAAAFAALAAQGREACDALMAELMQPFVRVLCSADPDAQVVGHTLLALELVAFHVSPSEVTEYNVAAPLVLLLDAPQASLRLRAVSLIAVLCEDEHGLAPARLLDAELVPSLVRLVGASHVEAASGTGGAGGGTPAVDEEAVAAAVAKEAAAGSAEEEVVVGEEGDGEGEEAGHYDGNDGNEEDQAAGGARLPHEALETDAFETLETAVSVLARLGQETRFARRLVDGDVKDALLQVGAPLHPDSSAPIRRAQLAALRCMCDLAGKVSEFKQALASDPRFFPLLFRLRDSTVPGVTAEAHAIAQHWGDDFFGWPGSAAPSASTPRSASCSTLSCAPSSSRQRWRPPQCPRPRFAPSPSRPRLCAPPPPPPPCRRPPRLSASRPCSPLLRAPPPPPWPPAAGRR